MNSRDWIFQQYVKELANKGLVLLETKTIYKKRR